MESASNEQKQTRQTVTEREFETLVREHRSTIYTVCYMFSTDKDEVVATVELRFVGIKIGKPSLK